MVTTPQVRAQLLAHAPEGVDAGSPVWLGLQIAHQPEWHTYWKNPGDSGLPTQLSWTMPAGVTAGDIAWPLPHKIRIGSLANLGYSDTVLLPIPLRIGKDFQPSAAGTLEVKLHASWLVCKKECIPEEGQFTLQVPVKGSTALHAAAFDAAQRAQPQALITHAAGAIPPSRLTVVGPSLQFEIQGLPVEFRGQTLELFPETAEVVETAATIQQEWKGAVWRASVPLFAQRSASPVTLPVVLIASDPQGGRRGVRAELAVQGTWPATAAVASVPPALSAALQANAAPPLAPAGLGAGSGAPLPLWLAVLGALIGGLFLNLMPCVFPVLAIKLLALSEGHGADPAARQSAQRQGALAYSAGVVLSFLALGGLMLALRSAGEQLGWGFQLQSPVVIAGLAALFTLLGLNLAGLFEFGSLLPASLAGAQLRHARLNALLSGVLAVAVASPCTAPFMGASLGLAVTLPGWQALPVFAALGIGMALPFLLAGWWPALANRLPRPGPWMQTFRQLMAFPMFATVAWLVWVLGQQSGIDGAAALLALLVTMAMLLWSLQQTGHARSVLTVASLALGVWLLVAWGPQIGAPAPAAPAAPGGRWQSWAPGKVEQVLAQGKPVFVDFTAAWCVTCQVNKKTTLNNPALQQEFDARQFTLLRADWTRRDPAITAALAQLGRSGVPVYVVYKPSRPPQVLSELIGVDEVRAAL